LEYALGAGWNAKAEYLFVELGNDYRWDEGDQFIFTGLHPRAISQNKISRKIPKTYVFWRYRCRVRVKTPPQ